MSFFSHRPLLLVVCLLSALLGGGLGNGCSLKQAFAESVLTPAQQKVLEEKQQEKAEKNGKNPDKAIDFDPTQGLSKEQQEALRQQLSASDWESLAQLHALVQEQQQALHNELEDDKETSLQELSLLWQAAVENSSSVRYAIEKLSHKDASGKPVKNDSFNRKLLRNIARLGGAAGSLVTGSPVGLLSGTIVSDMLYDGMPSGPNPVTDADMVLLTQTIEELQNKLVNRYYVYKAARERYELAEKAYFQLEGHYKALVQALAAPVLTPEAVAIAAEAPGKTPETSPKKPEPTKQPVKTTAATKTTTTKVAVNAAKPSVAKQGATSTESETPPAASGMPEGVSPFTAASFKPLLDATLERARMDVEQAEREWKQAQQALTLVVGPNAMRELETLRKAPKAE